MTDRDLRELLTDSVADVEPVHRLSEIRARTRRSRSRLWIPTGAALVAASVVAAAALVGQPSQQADSPGPMKAPSSTTASDPASPSTQPTPEGSVETVAVYYVGDTPDGPRLYREFQPVPAQDALSAAIAASVGTQPIDPDYFSGWPQTDGVFIGASVAADVITVEVGDPAVLVAYDYPTGVVEMALQQVIYTAQAAVQERLPVQFVYRGNPVAEVLGVPTSEPLAEGPALDTLALVSLTTPSEGAVVDNNEPLVVDGVGNSFEGNVVTRLQRLDGTDVIDAQPAIAGWGEGRLFSFEVTLDLTDVPPGDYEVVSHTDDPSGQGRFHTDTRLITVVD